jgi:pimeloyl-ACP methyl ester carboxylesterase
MYELPYQEYFCHGHMTARFLRPIRKHEYLILAVPGGPAISSVYLDAFMAGLSEHIRANVAVLDLPNHGKAMLPKDKLPLQYNDCLSYVGRTINEICKQSENVVLLGHSLGARMVLDLIAEGSCLAKAALFMSASDDMSGDHLKSWKKNLLSCFSTALTPEESVSLAASLKWDTNENIADKAPPLREVLKKFNSERPMPHIGFLDGEHETGTPSVNSAILEAIFPGTTLGKVPKATHFPMLENPLNASEQASTFFTRVRT